MFLTAALGVAQSGSPAPRPDFDEFDVATIKPAASSPGRYFKMQGAHQFYAKNFTLNALVAAAYNLNPQHQILGGPSWTQDNRYDILAGAPGEIQPNQDEQMRMLRKLLTERFKLTFHYGQREMAIYSLTIARGGPKLKESTAPVDKLPDLVSVVFPDHLRLPAHNATMEQFAAVMRHAWLDRPVVDQTGLSGKYDFDLEWTPDETQFGGQLQMKAPTDDNPRPDLFAALQQQLGLKLTATKGPAEVLSIDHVEMPSAN
jgi:uncharacterized protein (TIGR03435 family)